MLTALDQYIPLQNGQASFIKEQNLINDLLGVVGYEVRDGFVVFTEDITNPDELNVNAVDMQLVVMDIGKYGDYDILPLTADMAAQVVAEVVSLLMPTPYPDKRVDSMSEEPLNKRG
jgi:hypothetical protein